MEVDDQEWEAYVSHTSPYAKVPEAEMDYGAHRWKESGEQIDNRIVEVVWDVPRQTWKKLRFRDDKREGNYTKVVQAIIVSIKDGVEADVVRPLINILPTLCYY